MMSSLCCSSLLLVAALRAVGDFLEETLGDFVLTGTWWLLCDSGVMVFRFSKTLACSANNIAGGILDFLPPVVASAAALAFEEVWMGTKALPLLVRTTPRLLLFLLHLWCSFRPRTYVDAIVSTVDGDGCIAISEFGSGIERFIIMKRNTSDGFGTNFFFCALFLNSITPWYRN